MASNNKYRRNDIKDDDENDVEENSDYSEGDEEENDGIEDDQFDDAWIDEDSVDSNKEKSEIKQNKEIRLFDRLIDMGSSRFDVASAISAGCATEELAIEYINEMCSNDKQTNE